MVYTLTLNPSIDYVVRLDQFINGNTNRTSSEEYYIGGKGINVSCILRELGMSSTALGFTAGFVGDAIEKGLQDMGIHADFVRLPEGVSRINVKIMGESETEINGQGPGISAAEFDRLLTRTDAINAGDTVVLAGSVPKTVPDDAYERILRSIEWRDVRTVVDATGNLLLRCLAFRPFLIKPNRQELSELFGREIASEKDIESCAKELRKKGARNVIVSLGGDGAILYAEDGNVYQSGVVKGTVQSTVGSGDSMVAGFIVGFERTRDYAFSLKLGAACGNATAFSPGLAQIEKINDIFGKIQVRVIG